MICNTFLAADDCLQSTIGNAGLLRGTLAWVWADGDSFTATASGGWRMPSANEWATRPSWQSLKNYCGASCFGGNVCDVAHAEKENGVCFCRGENECAGQSNYCDRMFVKDTGQLFLSLSLSYHSANMFWLSPSLALTLASLCSCVQTHVADRCSTTPHLMPSDASTILLTCYIMALSLSLVTWYYPFDKLDDGGTSVTSTGENTGQLSATVHKGASLGDGRVEGTKALQFDGVGQSRQDGQHVSIDGGITVGGSAFTACAWTKWNTFGYWSRVINFGNGRESDNIYLCNRQTTKTLVWSIRRGKTQKSVYIGNILQPNTWTHICGTVSSSGYMAVLLNGVEQNCTAGTACDTSTGKGTNGWTPNRLLRSKAYIGRSSWDDNAYFAGSISDVTLIDGKAATEAEAVAMMRATDPTTTASSTTTITTTTTTATTKTTTTTTTTLNAEQIMNKSSAGVERSRIEIVTDFKADGMSAAELLSKGFTVQDLYDAGFTTTDLEEAYVKRSQFELPETFREEYNTLLESLATTTTTQGLRHVFCPSKRIETVGLAGAKRPSLPPRQRGKNFKNAKS